MSFDLKGWLPLIILGVMGYGCVTAIDRHEEDFEAEQAKLEPHERRVDPIGTMMACENAVRDRLKNPSTYERQSSIEDEIQTKPGMTVWRTHFTARNDLNLVRTYRLVCSQRYDGIVDASFKEAR